MNPNSFRPLTHHVQAGVLTINVEGAINRKHWNTWFEAFKTIIVSAGQRPQSNEDTFDKIVVDMKAVEAVDSSALALFLALRRLLSTSTTTLKSTELSFINPPNALLELAKIYNVPR